MSDKKNTKSLSKIWNNLFPKKPRISKNDLKIINDYQKSDIDDGKVPVNIWVCCYEEALLNNGLKMGIEDADVIDLETGDKFKADENGYIKTRMKPGRKLNLRGFKDGYGDLQTSTIVVGKKGNVGLKDEITLQIPGAVIWSAITTAFGKPKEGYAHLLTTIQKPDKNMHKDGGLSHATAKLVCKKTGEEIPARVYLGQIGGMTEWFAPVALYHAGNLSKKALKFFDKVDLGLIEKAGRAKANALKRYSESNKPKYTSHDGAAIWIDVPEGEYNIVAEHKDYEMSSPSITVRKDTDFINASPPHCPQAIAKKAVKAENTYKI